MQAGVPMDKREIVELAWCGKQRGEWSKGSDLATGEAGRGKSKR